MVSLRDVDEPRAPKAKYYDLGDYYRECREYQEQRRYSAQIANRREESKRLRRLAIGDNMITVKDLPPFNPKGKRINLKRPSDYYRKKEPNMVTEAERDYYNRKSLWERIKEFFDSLLK